MGSSLGVDVADVRGAADKSTTLDRLYPELEQILSAADAARGLLGDPGWSVLSSLLNAEIASIDARLDGRVLDSKAEYASLHGRRGGLRTPTEALHALISRAESRLDEQRSKHEDGDDSLSGGS